MDLSVEHFVQAITSLNTARTGDVPRDQRRRPRAILRARASIIPLAESSQPAAITIQVRDLSASGIGFLYEQKLSLDEQFALVLPRADDSPAVILCSVVFWQPLARDVFAIGARFSRILRDGGDPPLPVKLDGPLTPLTAEMERLRRKAS